MSDPISIDLLRRLLRCDPETGKLYWLPRTTDMFSDGGRHSSAHSCAKWNAKHAGKEAFTSLSDGRPHGRIFRRGYRASRVIWALVHGDWPDEVDHINRDPSDNRLCNLRACSHRENLYNQSSAKGSTSQYLGVRWDKGRGNWCAAISVAGRGHFLGRYGREDEAARAYDAAARRHFGQFANLNFPDAVRTQ